MNVLNGMGTQVPGSGTITQAPS